MMVPPRHFRSRPCRPRLTTLGIFLVIVASRAADGSDAAPPDRAPSTIRETQITLTTGQAQFQATVIAKEDRTLTILTSGHSLAPADVGQAVGISRGGERLRGRVVAVARNPFFQPVKARDRDDHSVRNIVGVDNAIATLVAAPTGADEERILRKIRPADMAPRAMPSGPRRIVSVHIVDRLGEEHVVRAGNHLNPKCLAWGQRSYAVKPGDSGAGVFILLKTAPGTTRPVLIGNVSLDDERGGIAPLVFRQDRWVEEALASRKSSEDEPG